MVKRRRLKTDIEPKRKKRNSGRNGGRPVGATNLMTRDVKEAIIEAASNLGGKQGLVGYFRKLAKQNPVVFAGLMSRLIPSQVNVRNTDLTSMLLEKLLTPP